jgi:chromosome partitioning protein
MLQWFKRNVTPAPSEQLVDIENQPLPSEKSITRLVGRLQTNAASANEHVAGLPQMRVIVVASQKGGVGKTTVAAHLAVHADMAGHGPAVLVDTDPQGSLSEWWDARKDEHQHEHEHEQDTLTLTTTKLDDLPARLAELRRNGAAVAIIDTPPAITASIKQVIEIADFVVIPARPSPHDLRAIAATVNLTRGAGKPFVFVINGAAPRANITAQAVAALSEHGQVAPVILYQRTDFAASMIDGRTVMETTATGRSAQEIAELWKCVSAQMTIRAAA